jgi:hypothetical protein
MHKVAGNLQDDEEEEEVLKDQPLKGVVLSFFIVPTP